VVAQQSESTLQPLLLTIPQVAKKLGLSRAMVYILINREGLPVIRLGRAVRVSATSLEKWVLEREQSSNQAQDKTDFFSAVP
jgi:excisionase family DNA binding protein